MYSVLTSRSAISRAQRALFSHVSSGEKLERSIGYQGGSERRHVYWHPGHGIWGTELRGDNRYLNWFGLEDPTLQRQLGITVEINPPVSGTDRRIAGVFLEDDRGIVYLGHRGNRINGVRKGRFRREFRMGRRGRWVRVIDEQGETEALLLYRVDDPDVIGVVADFAQEVQRIKNGGPRPRGTTDGYDPEFEGESEYFLETPIHVIRRHAKICNALKQEVESYLKTRKFRFSLSNRPYDLLVRGRKGKALVLFECKTLADNASVQTAIGQLMLYSIQVGGEPGKVVVLPDDVQETLVRDLKRLGFQVLRFVLRGKGKPRFQRLPRLLDSVLSE